MPSPLLGLIHLQLCFLITVTSFSAIEEAPQVGLNANLLGRRQIRFESVVYRPARWERKHVTEVETDRLNRGGLVSVYFTNSSSETLRTAFYRLNGHDESYWRLGYFLSWDRLYDRDLKPGQTTVLEINGITEDFSEGSPFDFTLINRNTWRPMGSISTRLKQDPVQISLIRFQPGLQNVEVHLRNRGEEALSFFSIEIVGHEIESVDWRGKEMAGVGNAIARLQLKEPLSPSSLVIAKVGVRQGGRDRFVYAHRRAFEDFFPIGTWGLREGKEAVYRRYHIDTFVRGGSASDPFFATKAEKYGFHAVVPVEKEPNIDYLRGLGDNPAVVCWMLADEPDWNTVPANMLLADNIVRRYNRTKPTYINLCRNVKFFEYAPIADIPCHDHYCVTAPSSSKWPFPYGTRLEETAYYTRDLKLASEPKPIWAWSQGIHKWDERPKMPLPTPEELTAQLWLNVGRAAKGILWFTFDLEMGEKYPDTRRAVRDCGRILSLIRRDLQGSEPYDARVSAPDTVDVATLASWDRVFVFLTNTDYKIDDEAYRWTPVRDLILEIGLPAWIAPRKVVELTPEGPKEMHPLMSGSTCRFRVGELEVCKILVISNREDTLELYAKEFAKILNGEAAVEGK